MESFDYSVRRVSVNLFEVMRNRWFFNQHGERDWESDPVAVFDCEEDARVFCATLHESSE